MHHICSPYNFASPDFTESRTGKILTSVSMLLLISLFCVQTSSADSYAWKETRVTARVVPEYDREMRRVVVSLCDGIASLELQHEILLRVPDYTSIILLVSRRDSSGVASTLRNTPYAERTTIVTFDPDVRTSGELHLIDNGKGFISMPLMEPTPLQLGTRWAQDLFIPVVTSGMTTRIVTPSFYMCLCTGGKGIIGKPEGDNRFVASLETAGLEFVKLPMSFSGGNIAIVEAGGKRIALCGGDILRDTRDFRKQFPSEAAPDTLVARMIGGALGVDRVVFVGHDTFQPRLMFHLDQALISLPGGVAAVTRIAGNPADFPGMSGHLADVGRFLEVLRDVLDRLGVTVVDIDAPVHNIVNYEFYVNAIPFRHVRTGKRTLLMPVFEQRHMDDPKIIKTNTERLESLGYTVIHVPTKAGSLKGGVHCLVNMIE